MRTPDYIVLTGLKISCIIGIFDWERKQKQAVLIDLKIPCDAHKASQKDNISDAMDYKKIAKTTIAFVEKSDFQLVETLGEKLAELLLKTFRLTEIELSVSKPAAIRGSQNVGVKIHRAQPVAGSAGLIFLNLGSNVNPEQNLNLALREISQKYPLQGLSHVYETSPVGDSNQSVFWNMAAAVSTHEKPEKIRLWSASLEKKAGRKKTTKNFGPRTLDVDLIVWKDLVQKSKTFQLPHPDIAAKAFVLFPLLEINPTWIHPETQKSIIELAALFKDKSQKIRQLPEETFAAFLPRPIRK
ncbi:MAG TPA: 2-amino-4-hydroxy-6-hydroxymethyldihydropteridine diphosphokinase [bacterium]|nr:2-amino-4-hydroxy-6-hydroxymethyldihydropteridine diphosphokinase [bacterium]